MKQIVNFRNNVIFISIVCNLQPYDVCKVRFRAVEDKHEVSPVGVTLDVGQSHRTFVDGRSQGRVARL